MEWYANQCELKRGCLINRLFCVLKLLLITFAYVAAFPKLFHFISPVQEIKCKTTFSHLFSSILEKHFALLQGVSKKKFEEQLYDIKTAQFMCLLQSVCACISTITVGRKAQQNTHKEKGARVADHHRLYSLLSCLGVFLKAEIELAVENELSALSLFFSMSPCQKRFISKRLKLCELKGFSQLLLDAHRMKSISLTLDFPGKNMVFVEVRN